MGGTPLFDTGTYVYDGAGNISSIGPDVYRYDLAGRLRRAKVVSGTFPTGLYLDYGYDEYGNMVSRNRKGSNLARIPLNVSTLRLIGPAL